MGSISDFLTNFNWQSLLLALMRAAATLLCFTVHELCHGLTAWKLGDPTAKERGRLTLNPFKHIDLFGLLMMVTVRVGWAKPVPIDMRNFKRPKRDMALTALAGPASNIALAWVFLLIARLLVALLDGMPMTHNYVFVIGFYALLFFLQGALLSVGLAVFNLIPIPPLDGSKVLFSFFPDRIYLTILRYERYIVLVLLACTWFGLFNRPLNFLIPRVLYGLCLASGLPFEYFYLLF